MQIEISGLGIEDGFTKSKIEKEIENSIIRLDKHVDVKSFNAHFKKSNKGGKPIHFVTMKVETDLGIMNADSEGYELSKVLRESLDKVEREIGRAKDKKNA